MCTVILAFQQHPQWEWIILSNRDEFYQRPSKAMHHWTTVNETTPVEILSGLDLKAMGTWLAVSGQGRFATLTNYRDFSIPHKGVQSRGFVPLQFLSETHLTAPMYLDTLKATAHSYDPFNLIIGDRSGLYFFSHQLFYWEKLAAGVHGVSNAHLNTPWFKVEKGKTALKAVLEKSLSTAVFVEEAFKILGDETEAPQELLPSTGLDPEKERLLSRMHINSDTYGTRFKTIILKDYAGHFHIWEWSLTDNGQWEQRQFNYI